MPLIAQIWLLVVVLAIAVWLVCFPIIVAKCLTHRQVTPTSASLANRTNDVDGLILASLRAFRIVVGRTSHMPTAAMTSIVFLARCALSIVLAAMIAALIADILDIPIT